MSDPTKSIEDGDPSSKALSANSQILIETTDLYLTSTLKFDIVAVHGLYGRNEKSWAGEESTWLKSLAISNKWQVRIIRYGWNTEDLATSLYTRKAITREALKLLEKLAELREGQDSPLPLAFFAHDVGGIIVKEALFLASQYGNKMSDIFCSTRNLIFFGSPHRSTNIQHMETNIARLLLTKTGRINTLQDARTLAKAVTAVNNSFMQTRMLTRATITNVVSNMDNIQEQIFDASITSFCTALDIRVDVKKPHASLDEDPKGSDFHTIGIAPMGRTSWWPSYTDEISPLIDVLESHAAPVYGLKSIYDPIHKFDWLETNEAFHQFLEDRHTCYLHIHGSFDISEAAAYAFKSLNEHRNNKTVEEILYFKFNKYDTRCNSIGAMANTFLNQTFSKTRIPSTDFGEAFEPPDFSDCWTDQDAFIFLDKIRRGLGWARKVTWILDGLDQCDESSHLFLAEILSIAARSEQWFKVIITSVDDKYIREALSQFPAINLKEHEATKESLTSPDFPLMTEVLQDRSQLSYFESDIRDLANSCRNDDQLCRLLLEWLRVTPSTTRQAMEQEIRVLSTPSPRSIFERILETVSENRRPWAQKVIMWMMYSVRPLTPEELETALAIEEARDETTTWSFAHFDIMEEIENCFGPLFVLENGEICLGHSSIREIFYQMNTPVQGSRPWYVLGDTEEIHKKIVDICLRFLILPNVQDQILAACKATPNGQPIFQGQSNIISYAIQFWPKHYQLGYGKFAGVKASETISGFLRNGQALRRWSAANWYFSNPHIRSDRSFLSSSLPIIASLGLEKLVPNPIKGQGPNVNMDVSMALLEASRNGYYDTVQTLLEVCIFTQSGYLDAIMNAARSAKFDILGSLLEHMKKRLKKIQLPSMLASRIAFFGINDILESLIESGIEIDAPTQPHCTPPLHCAVMRNNISTVNLLLRHGVNPNRPNENYMDNPPIVFAVKYGYAAMIKKLIAAGASIETKDRDDRSALWWAATLGQHEAIQALVDAGVDNTSILVAVNEKLAAANFLNSVGRCFFKSIEILLRSGLDPNVSKMKERGINALSNAALSGDASMCHLLLKYGADVNGSDGYRPVIHAAASNKVEMLALIIEAGADVNVIVDTSALPTNDRARTALLTAVVLINTEMVALLLKNNVAVDTALPDGITALLAASDLGFAEGVKLLIANGASFKAAAGETGWGVLHRASNKVNITNILLDAGADIEAASKVGTALYIAASNGYDAVLEVLVLRGANLEVRYGRLKPEDTGYTPLQVAAQEGHHESMRILLEAGADPNSRNIPPGKTPVWTALMLAVWRRQEEAIKVLLEYDVDLEVVDSDNDTAMYEMQSNPSLPILKLLVNRGANIEHRGGQGYTFLSWAVASGSVDIVKYLIDKKANINVIGGFRGGPIHLAAHLGSLEILKLLIQKGGDVNLVDLLMGTPLQAAINPFGETKNDAVQYLIEEAGADVNVHGGWFGSTLNAACLRSSLEQIKQIIGKGADVNWADDFGRRPIHYASLKTLEHLKLLLDAGSDITAKTKTGQSLLHIATVTGNAEFVESILSKTNDLINDPDDDGWTPLMWACRISNQWCYRSSIEISVIKLLISHGADLWVQGKSSQGNWSPLKLARYHGASTEIMKLLTPKRKTRTTKDGKKEVWDDDFHTSRRVKPHPGAYCDLCLMDVYGSIHTCRGGCADAFCFCFKCWSRKDEFHPQHDNWEHRDEEFYSDEEEEKEDKETSATESVQRVEDDDDDGNWSSDEEQSESGEADSEK